MTSTRLRTHTDPYVVCLGILTDALAEGICYPYLCDQLMEDLNQSMRDAGVRATVLEDARDGESLSVRLMLNDLAELDNVISCSP